MARSVFLTGFPGFLASSLVERLLERYPRDDVLIHCVVQPQFHLLAQARAAELDGANRIRLHTGDITLSAEMGMDEDVVTELRNTVAEVYHLAAIYDLAVKWAVGMAVNVKGTGFVLDFAQKCPSLRRVHYISTCFVSGKWDGSFSEADLEASPRQVFNNFYEETKFLAELEVQRRMREDDLPCTIYRPPIVLGDSATGETQKYDGPYSVFIWCMYWSRSVPMVTVGDGCKHHLNMVPRDFVVDAIAYLSAQDHTVGQVFNLSDPNEHSVTEILDIVARTTKRDLTCIPLPTTLAKFALQYVPYLGQLMGLSPHQVDYFVHPTRYVCAATQKKLADGGVECPQFEAYLPNLLKFMTENPNISMQGMS